MNVVLAPMIPSHAVQISPESLRLVAGIVWLKDGNAETALAACLALDEILPGDEESGAEVAA